MAIIVAAVSPVAAAEVVVRGPLEPEVGDVRAVVLVLVGMMFDELGNFDGDGGLFLMQLLLVVVVVAVLVRGVVGCGGFSRGDHAAAAAAVEEADDGVEDWDGGSGVADALLLVLRSGLVIVRIAFCLGIDIRIGVGVVNVPWGVGLPGGLGAVAY